jgi:TolB protein
VKRTAVALWLAGLAAAGLALIVTGASTAADSHIGWVTDGEECTPSSQPGQAVETQSRITVGGRALPDKRSPLRRGDRVKTSPVGKGLICLKRGNWKCSVWPDTDLRVVPPRTTRVVIQLVEGTVTCSSESGDNGILTSPRSRLFVGGDVDAARGPTDARQVAASVSTQVFSMSVVKGRSLVKVRRGAGIVARKGTLANAVVLARKQQTVVPADRRPQQPTPLSLTAAERKEFASRERPLVAETDFTKPKVDIQGPRAPSSIRDATFALRASEESVFSCALDDKDFRLCSHPSHVLQRLPPGRHTLAVRATDAAGRVGSASFSWVIDSSRIVFESFRDGNPEIYAMDPDGQNVTRLTTNSISDEHPDWSPGQRQIAFDRLVGENLEIFAMNADGSSATRLTEHPERDRNPSWSPDGTRIAFESYRDGNREIYVMDADGSGERRLTTHPAEDLDPAWAPDSRSLVFASTRDGNYEIYVMSAEGGDVRRLTNHPAEDFGPSWSPTGSRIAFHSLQTGDYKNIYVIPADGGSPRRVTRTTRNDTNPSWAPDSGHIVFHSDRESGAEDQLYIVDADTLEQGKVPTTSTRANFAPDW